jgi:hypothetical protein
MLTLLPKGLQTKLLKFFLLKVKIRNGPNGIIRGLGENGSRKKPEAKNLVSGSL